jgi:hypothetical protein
MSSNCWTMRWAGRSGLLDRTLEFIYHCRKRLNRLGLHPPTQRYKSVGVYPVWFFHETWLVNRSCL